MKFTKLLLATSAVVACGTVTAMATTSIVQNIQAQLRPDYTIIIDGQVTDFVGAEGGVISPINYNGTTYLPLRAIGELMGKEVGWQNDTKTITLDGGNTAVTFPSITSGSNGLINIPTTTTGSNITAEKVTETIEKAIKTISQLDFNTKDLSDIYNYVLVEYGNLENAINSLTKQSTYSENLSLYKEYDFLIESLENVLDTLEDYVEFDRDFLLEIKVDSLDNKLDKLDELLERKLGVDD